MLKVQISLQLKTKPLRNQDSYRNVMVSLNAQLDLRIWC